MSDHIVDANKKVGPSRSIQDMLDACEITPDELVGETVWCVSGFDYIGEWKRTRPIAEVLRDHGRWRLRFLGSPISLPANLYFDSKAAALQRVSEIMEVTE